MNPLHSAFGMTVDRLLGLTSPTQDWLLRAGPIAKRLNEESKRDGRRINGEDEG